jgi:hypothetical protein
MNAIRGIRRRFWIEVAMGVTSGILAILTVIWPDWIELAFGIEPDAGNGSLEIAITLAMAVVSVLFVLFARLEWRARTTATIRG